MSRKPATVGWDDRLTAAHPSQRPGPSDELVLSRRLSDLDVKTGRRFGTTSTGKPSKLTKDALREPAH